MRRASISKARLRGRRGGVALIIVLAFIVLLTAVVVAFFSRAISERQISTASSGQVKVDLLAEGAVNTVIGDLKEEIAAGSIVTSGSVVNSGTTYNMCIPSAQWSMVPCVSGTVGGAPWLPPNVLKRSAAGQPFYSGTNYNFGNNFISTVITGTSVTSSTTTVTYPVINRASMEPAGSSLLSSTNPSLNGRSISVERWNEPYLIPIVTGATQTTGSTQTTGTMADGTAWQYAAPDWVLVERSGSNPNSSATMSSLSWSSTTATTVVGRYAYIVYNEGGLLDMNVAGYPSTVTGTTATVKSSLAMADLTQLGLSGSQVDAIVRYWRNPGTIAMSSGNYRDNMVQADGTTGFRAVNPKVVGDNAFPSRQSLINYMLQDVPLASGSTVVQLENALNYMGTFSRSLEQPSFAPNPNRPRIVNASVSPPPLTPPTYSGANGYMGNNDGAGGDDIINPKFQSILTTSTFTRMDGSTALIGEPLVKKRFPLSRLNWITYAGPSNGTPGAALTTATGALLSIGVTAATISGGTPTNIYNAFGLTWNASSGSWTYYHGASHIMTLQEVAAAGREPDFPELLKAAINVGSLAKAAPNVPGTDFQYQYSMDYSVDYNIIQITANLIDQADPDSFPTIIQFQNSAGQARTFRGVEDLPYFYRFHPFSVVTQLPSPILTSNQSVTLSSSTSVVSNYGSGVISGSGFVSYTFSPAEAGTLTSTGSAYLFYVPELWNPHDTNMYTSKMSNFGRPQTFRVTMDTADPAGLTAWSTSAIVKPSTNITGTNASIGSPNPTQPTSPLAALASSTNSKCTIGFTDNNGQLYREPTLIWRSHYPTNSAIGVIAGGALVADANTNARYVGMPIGVCPVSVQITATVPGQSGSNYILQGATIDQGPTAVGGTPSSPMYTFQLQYQNTAVTGTSWITYDVKYADNHNLGAPNLVVNINDPKWSTNQLYDNPLKEGDGQLSDTSGVHDPLTARFGVGLGYNWMGQISLTGSQGATTAEQGGYVLDGAAQSAWLPNNSSGNGYNSALNTSNFCMLESDRPRTDFGIYVELSNPCMAQDPGLNQQMRWFSGIGYYPGNAWGSVTPLQFDGLLSQNNPAITFVSRDGTRAANYYYEDPDGIARRAMGAYAETTMSGTASTVGLPEVTANTFGGAEGVPTASAYGQSESRPIILNRPLRSVAEMSNASRGLPWKNIDFFTPESGDTALLDVFCVNELPPSNLVAGKVDVNTRQPPVLQAILAGGFKDDLINETTNAVADSGTASICGGTIGVSSTLSDAEASAIAQLQVTRSIDTVNGWHGPVANIGELVGRFVSSSPNTNITPSYNDPYIYMQPAFPPILAYPPVTSGVAYTYSGLSGALSTSGTNGTITSSVFANLNTALIQRGRESAIRPLVDCGQTRVWNLMVDVIAQSGRYPTGAGDPTKFQVEGEKRYWVHVAIDRYTGAVLDKQVEVVTE